MNNEIIFKNQFIFKEDSKELGEVIKRMNVLADENELLKKQIDLANANATGMRTAMLDSYEMMKIKNQKLVTYEELIGDMKTEIAELLNGDH